MGLDVSAVSTSATSGCSDFSFFAVSSVATEVVCLKHVVLRV